MHLVAFVLPSVCLGIAVNMRGSALPSVAKGKITVKFEAKMTISSLRCLSVSVTLVAFALNRTVFHSFSL